MKGKSRRRLWTGLAVLSGAAALWFGYSTVHTLWEYSRSDRDIEEIYRLMDQASETAQSAAEAETETGGNTDAPGTDPGGSAGEEKPRLTAEQEERLAGYRALREINPDMIGWIRIDGTVIDYPVMQTPDREDYYLHRGFDGEYSSYGMIYMDETCKPGKSPNCLIYGHHMRNGSMFAALEGYTDPEFWQQHPTVEFDTLTEPGSYQVIGAFRIPAEDLDVEFLSVLSAGTQERYEQLVDYVRENCAYDSGIVPQWPQQLITLTTCEYTHQDGRLMVVAVKTEEQS